MAPRRGCNWSCIVAKPDVGNAEPKLAKGEQTRLRILAAAEIVFAELGFNVARMEDVAQRVGVRRPSLIYHFKDKQDLYDAVKTDIYNDLNAQTVQRLPRDGTALERLQSLVDSWLDFMIERPTAAHILLRNTVERQMPKAPGAPRFSETVVKTFEKLVKEGQKSGEFGAVNSTQLMLLVGNGILNYVFSGQLIGGGRAYDPAAPKYRESYRELLNKTLRALLIEK